MSFIYCRTCQAQGVSNKCYITGYNTKCGHDNGWARPTNQQGTKIMTCKRCPSNNMYITGYDIKCGHDNGYAYHTPPPATGNAQCLSCSADLGGKWSMENNPSNAGYQNSLTGRYLGVPNGYFLYYGNPNWVYSYCRPCWIKELHKLAPSIGLTTSNEQVQAENKIKDEKIVKLEKEKEEFQLENKLLREKLQKLETMPPVVPSSECGEFRMVANLFPQIEKEHINALDKVSQLEAPVISETVSQILETAAVNLTEEISALTAKAVQNTTEKIQNHILLVENALETQIMNINEQILQIKNNLEPNSLVPASVIESTVGPLKSFVVKKEEQKLELAKMKEMFKI